MGPPGAWAASYPDLILSDNPVAYYRLEELAGASTAVDATANHLDGDIVPNGDGTSPQLGLPGIDTNSFNFLGGSDFGVVTLNYNPALSPIAEDGVHGAPFSVECWVQSSALQGDYSVPLSMFGPYESGAPYSNASGWNFYQSAPSGGQSFWIFNLKNGAFITASTPITLLQWYHLAATFDGTNASFYIDGVPVGGPQASGGYLADHNANGQIGAGSNTGFLPFKGGVDEVAFYTNALTGAQILAHYQLGTNSFRAVPTPPDMVTQPTSSTNYSGTKVTFTALANGTAPVSYQWQRGSGAISGATNSTYSFVCKYPDDNGATFSVHVSNSVGSTNSDVATLTVLTNLNILYGPFGGTRNVGSKAALRVVADGAQPITYQWFQGTGQISGATNDTLWLNNVQLSNSDTYHAHVANPFTSADSTNATLTVQARPVTVPLTGYAKLVAADDPVAYWRLDEPDGSAVATDAVGSFDGSYDVNSGAFVYASPTGIPHETDTAINLTGGAVVTIPYALELNPVTGPWTAEAWVMPASLDPGNFRTVFSSMWNSDSGGHLFGWNVYQHVAGVWTLNMYNGGAGGSFTSDFVHNPIVTNTWYHMVITDDLISIRYYVNNALVVTLDRNGFGFIPNGINGDVSVAGAPTVLGQRSDNAFGAFDGTIDDVAFYNYAMSPDQVQAHFLNATKITVAKSGGNLVLSWPSGTLVQANKVTGPYAPVNGAASPFTVTPGSTNTFYQILTQ